MGITFLKVKVINPEKKEKRRECRFLVDSGAIYSVVPSEILSELEINAIEMREFILANGEVIKRPVGNAYFEYEGRTGASPVIFGESSDVYLLGITTLESLGLFLDPVKRELKPLPMLLM